MKRTPEVFGKDVRKIVRMGNMLAVSLPKRYIEAHGLKQGDLVELFFNRIVHIQPIDVEEIKTKLGKTEKREIK